MPNKFDDLDKDFSSTFSNGRDSKKKDLQTKIAETDAGLEKTYKDLSTASKYGGYDPATSTIVTAVTPEPAPSKPKRGRAPKAAPGPVTPVKPKDTAKPDPLKEYRAERRKGRYEKVFKDRHHTKPPPVAGKTAVEACKIYEGELASLATPDVATGALMSMVAALEEASMKQKQFRERFGTDLNGLSLEVQREIAREESLAWDLKELWIKWDAIFAMGPEARVFGALVTIGGRVLMANKTGVAPEEFDSGDVEVDLSEININAD